MNMAVRGHQSHCRITQPTIQHQRQGTSSNDDLSSAKIRDFTRPSMTWLGAFYNYTYDEGNHYHGSKRTPATWATTTLLWQPRNIPATLKSFRMEQWHPHDWPVTTTNHLPPHLVNCLGHQRESVFVWELTAYFVGRSSRRTWARITPLSGLTSSLVQTQCGWWKWSCGSHYLIMPDCWCPKGGSFLSRSSHNSPETQMMGDGCTLVEKYHF